MDSFSSYVSFIFEADIFQTCLLRHYDKKLLKTYTLKHGYYNNDNNNN